MFRATNSPILRSTFWLYIQLLVQCTDTAADLCHGWDGTVNNQQDTTTFSFINLFNSALHVSGDKFAHPQEHLVKKCSWGWANLSPEICRAELKRLIKEKFVAFCWLFTSSNAMSRVLIIRLTQRCCCGFGLLECDAVSFGEWFCLDCLDLGDETTTLFETPRTANPPAERRVPWHINRLGILLTRRLKRRRIFKKKRSWGHEN